MFSKLKSLFVTLNKGGFSHLFVSSVLNKMLGFLNNIFLVRFISKAEYGIYSNANNLLGFFCLLSGFGMATTLLQFGCIQEGEEKNKTWSFVFYFSIIFDALLSVSIAIYALFAEIKIEGTNEMLLLMAFLPLVRIVGELQRVYLRTEMKNKEYAFTNNFSAVVTVVSAVVLSYLFEAKGLIAANYITAIGTSIFIFFKYKIPLPSIRLKLAKEKIIELLKFSVVCVFNNSLSSVMHLLDTFVLGISVAQSVVTASYKVATTIPGALAFLPSCIMIYIYPYFAKKRDDGEWLVKNFKKVLLYFGAFNFAVVAVLIVFAPIIIKLIFGSQYLDAITPFRILCLTYAIQASFSTVPGQLNVTQGKLKFNVVMSFISCVMNTVLNFTLVPSLGMNGAAIATLAVMVVCAVCNTTYFYSVIKRKAIRQ